MHRFDGRVYFRLLAAVAAADGEVHRKEVDRFRELLRLAHADPEAAPALCTEALDHRSAPLWFLSDSVAVDPELARLCVRDALLLAAADGWTSEAERALIVAAAGRMGVAAGVEGLPPVQANPGPVPLAPDEEVASVAAVEAGLQGAGAPPEGHRQGYDPSLYFRLLAAVAAVDEEVREVEISRFEDLLELFGADRAFARPLCREAMLRRDRPLWFLDRVGHVDPSFVAVLLHEATLIATADGSFGPGERALLQEAAARLGVPDHPFPEPDLPWLSPEGEEAADAVAESARLDRTLALATGAGIVAGGSWVLLGGVAGTVAAGIVGLGAGSWLVPLAVLVGAGGASALLPVLRRLAPERDGSPESGPT